MANCKPITPLSWFWVVAAALANMAGCVIESGPYHITDEATFHAYEGPVRSGRQLGMLLGSASSYHTSVGVPVFPGVYGGYRSDVGSQIVSVDGRFRNRDRADKVMVSPGLHWVEASIGSGTPGQQTLVCVFEVQIQAGHVYEIRGSPIRPETKGFFETEPRLWRSEIRISDHPSIDHREGTGIWSNVPVACSGSIWSRNFCRDNKDCESSACERPSGYVAGLCE